MRIEILRDTSISGTAVKAGQVVDCGDSDARYLLATRKAKPAGSQPMAAVEEAKPPMRRKRKPATTPEE